MAEVKSDVLFRRSFVLLISLVSSLFVLRSSKDKEEGKGGSREDAHKYFRLISFGLIGKGNVLEDDSFNSFCRRATRICSKDIMPARKVELS